MQHHAPLREEALELPVLHERHHQQQGPDGDEEQARERVGGLDQELVVRGGALGFDGGYLRGVEHHEGSARESHQRMQHADQEKPRRGHPRKESKCWPRSPSAISNRDSIPRRTAVRPYSRILALHLLDTTARKPLKGSICTFQGPQSRTNQKP
ncbi:hypothetical protein EUGRSUZ_F03315 [Eucalyptus grandis]|uniref:Uncharacterized protein n=2 Tax=Eucalyptus grandis TaxID=71139 RepID=A0ACC3KLX7_EUCGR|nr:hypothetical protein EUGRSUZ_F03315 [Eucalyptus grandis]